MVLAPPSKNWGKVGFHVSRGSTRKRRVVDHHRARVFFATASSSNFTDSSSLEQSTSLFRVSTLQSVTYLTYALRIIVTIFSTRLLEICNIFELLIKHFTH